MWVIWPERAEVTVWRADSAAITLGRDDTLDGEVIVPGFACAIESLPRKPTFTLA